MNKIFPPDTDQASLSQTQVTTIERMSRQGQIVMSKYLHTVSSLFVCLC